MQGRSKFTVFGHNISPFDEHPNATLLHDNLMSNPQTDAGSPHNQVMDDLTMSMENLNSTGKDKRLRATSKKKH